MLLELSAILLLVYWVWWRQKTARFWKLIETFPGPRSLPIIGTVRHIRGSTAELFQRINKTSEKYAIDGAPFRLIFGSAAVIFLNDPKDFKIILSSQTNIDKGSFYELLRPWLGTGLLTGTGEKWRHHRKLITPAFHFQVLEKYLDVFNANGDILVHKLQEHVDAPGFDVYKHISVCMLENIWEAATGVKMNSQNDCKSEYVEAARTQSEILIARTLWKPWLRIDALFNMSKLKDVHDKSLATLYKITNNVISARRDEIERERKQTEQTKTAHDTGVKKWPTLLDILIKGSLENKEIQEEVDTIMLGGHDTSASAISFALWVLSWHQDIQEQVFLELKEVFANSEEPATVRQLTDLKYLERVIKETLRLFPSAPMMSRKVQEDVTLSGGLVVPKLTTVHISIYTSHTHPSFWPDPLKFDPDRFTPENIQGRHPYAYIPFSAGPRNCLGQKFAMLEMKSTLSQILRAFKILPGSEKPDLQLANKMTLISTNGVPIRLERRDFDDIGK